MACVCAFVTVFFSLSYFVPWDSRCARADLKEDFGFCPRRFSDMDHTSCQIGEVSRSFPFCISNPDSSGDLSRSEIRGLLEDVWGAWKVECDKNESGVGRGERRVIDDRRSVCAWRCVWESSFYYVSPPHKGLLGVFSGFFFFDSLPFPSIIRGLEIPRSGLVETGFLSSLWLLVAL